MKKVFTTLIIFLVARTVYAVFPSSQLILADPYVFYENGIYYAYGTHSGDGIEVWTSSDMIVWENKGLALHKSNTTESRWFWAPEVYNKNGEYIMYYSANEHLYVAKSVSPLGPFEQVGTYQMNSILGDEKCIDSSAFFDDDGKAYLFFVRFTDGNCIWMCELEDDYITPVEGTLKLCLTADMEWEKVWGRVAEGPSIVKHNGIYYLTYSANDYQSQDYAVGYATTTSLSDPQWIKSPTNPIVHRVYDLVGTGHHTIFTDKDGGMRIAFHAHKDRNTIHDRVTYIGRMQFNGDLLELAKEPVIRPTISTTDNALGYLLPSIIDTDWGYERGAAVTVDLDNDGHQDIISGGTTRNVHNSSARDSWARRRLMHIALWDNAQNNWNHLDGKTSSIQVADSPALIPCDINCDGIMDIVAFESIGESITADAYKNNYGNEGIFLGNGDGTFDTATINLLNPDGSEYTFDIKAISTCEVADIDNNGLLDLICIGTQNNVSYNLILRNLGYSGADFSFSVEPFATEYILKKSIIQVADFNNDSYIDFIVSANVSGVEGMSRFTDIFINDPQNPGTFSMMGLGDSDSGVLRKAENALQVADFNNDRLFDFYLSGNGDAATGESVMTQKIYLNQGEGIKPRFSHKSSCIDDDLYNVSNYVNNAAGIIDWDGDGYIDIIATGYMSDILRATTGFIYKNMGDGIMNRLAQVPGAMSSTIIFPDWNGDGNKDLFISGYSSDNIYFTSEQQGRVMSVSYNDNKSSSRPEAPTDCIATVDGETVTLSWNEPKNCIGTYTYEFYIKDAEGNFVTGCSSFVGGDLDGTRKVDRFGNAGYCTKIQFHPTASGSYQWGVQAINGAYVGSEFASGNTFTCEISGIELPKAEAPSEVARYDMLGRRLTKSVKGLNIIKMSDGSVVKRIVK